MLEFFVVIVLIIGSVLIIPYGVSKMTVSEVEDSQFRDLFWSEAGYRGKRVLCAIFCFWPIMIIFKRPDSVEGWVIAAAAVAYGYYEHFKLYKNVQIFDFKYTAGLICLVLFHLFINAMNYISYIGSYSALLILSISALFWGWFVNLKRCRILAKSMQKRANAI
jgi:hypothetical protein